MTNALQTRGTGWSTPGERAGALVVLAVALVAASPTWADTTTAQPAPVTGTPASHPKAGGDDAVVCKTITYTGSRLGASKTCLSRAQWRQYEVDSQDATVDSQMRADRGNPMGH